MSKPDRSDARLPPEEAARIEAEARGYFESLAPKRHPKPPRSEPYNVDSEDDLQNPSDPDSIPEFQKLRYLEANRQKLGYDGSEEVEEYIETEYYDDLNRVVVDNQHHATGTGFIKMDQPNGSCIDLTPVSGLSYPTSCKGNPATNEWIPSDDTVIPISRKPNRSDP